MKSTPPFAMHVVGFAAALLFYCVLAITVRADNSGEHISSFARSAIADDLISRAGQNATKESDDLSPFTFDLRLGGASTAASQGNSQVDFDTGDSTGSNSALASIDYDIIIAAGPPPPPPRPPPPPPPLYAYWVNTAGGTFGTAMNWDSAVVPGFYSVAVFDRAATYTVNVGSAWTELLVVQNGDVTFTDMAYTVGFRYDTVVLLDNAKLTLASGQLKSRSAVIGRDAASRLNVNSGAVWISTGSVQVGGAGAGFLAIAAGGTVQSDETRIGNGIGTGEAFIGGTNATWKTGNFAVGSNGVGKLTISEGARVESGDSSIGRNFGSSGTVTIEGEDVSQPDLFAVWDIGPNTLVVGVEGRGDLEILNGGAVYAGKLIIGQSRTAIGSMTIRGVTRGANPIAAAIILHGDAIVDGKLQIELGGQADSKKGSLGLDPGVRGDVLVEGNGNNIPSKWTLTDELTVGGDGIGSLQIKAGAQVIGTTCVIGRGLGSVGSEIVVEGVDSNDAPSEFALSGNLTVGSEGTVTFLKINDGAVSNAAFVQVGEKTSSRGSIIVSGRRSDTIASTLIASHGMAVGGDGDGVLTVRDGGKVSVPGGNLVMGGAEYTARAMTIGGRDTRSSLGAAVNVNGNFIMGSQARAHDTLTIEEDGGLSCIEATIGTVGPSSAYLNVGTVGGTGAPAEFRTTGDLTVGQSSESAPGVVALNGGIITVGGSLVMNTYGVIIGNGTLSAATRVRNSGLISTGLSPGLLTVNGGFEQTSTGTLMIEIGGTTPGMHGQLVVHGDVSLGGKLVLRFTDDFVPTRGDQFALLETTGTTTGDFARVEVRGLEPGFHFSAVPNATGQLVLTALNDGVPLSRKGVFRGLLTGDPAGHDTAGFFSMQTTARGSFAARFVLGGGSFALKGKFDAEGKFSTAIPRKGGSPLTVSLALAIVDDARAITGTILDGEHTVRLSADSVNAFNVGKKPAPQAGKYTALLPFDPATIDAPKANGIGMVSISKGGAIRLTGALADGTRLSQGTALSGTGKWPLYVLLYKKKGSLFGTLNFRDEARSDFDGALHWARPPTPGGKFQSAGFLSVLPAIGSRYVAPPARATFLDLPSGATATLSDAYHGTALVKELTLTAENRFAVSDPGLYNFSLSATAANGLLSARFVHPASGLHLAVQGVLFQKKNFGSGFYLHPYGIGSFDLQAKP